MLGTNEYTDWTGGRNVATMGTNSGSIKLPFQEWRRFKEAFAPELVARAIQSSNIEVKSCVDPFGGSGTTALTCQFLGVASDTIEVNPYLADLIKAKTAYYDCDKLASDLGEVVRKAASMKPDFAAFTSGLPDSFIQKPSMQRWLFGLEAAAEILRLRTSIDALESSNNRRLFRVMLGGILIGLSNVIVSGKGRRYRKAVRNVSRHEVLYAFTAAVQAAATEIYRFAGRSSYETVVLSGDSRTLLNSSKKYDTAIFSPPYCNSFDYTDIYNVELWMLGYLCCSDDNARLRASTLCSHVQHSRDYPSEPDGSRRLSTTMKSLRLIGDSLWHRRLPDMVAGYFADMLSVLASLHRVLRPNALTWIVVADSRYGGVKIATAQILLELAANVGFETSSVESFRTLRTSAQQGGHSELNESLLVLRRT